MIRAIVDFALNNRFLILAAAVLLMIWGVISFHNLPIEAYPDIANNYVQVITQWPGRAAEEVEQQVTIPLEMVLNGIPHLEHLRSTSMFGISSVMLIFDDSSDNNWNRQKVQERLTQAELPEGLEPEIGTDFSPNGEIYWYTLKSTNPRYDLMELKSLQDWLLEKQLLSVPNVVDVSALGGITREYQVRIDPDKLVSYGLGLRDVEDQLSANNVNGGGSFVEVGLQQVHVRSVGLIQNVNDIRKIVIKTENGTPIRIGDIAEVSQGAKIRLGQVGKAIHRADGRIIDDDDVVEGTVFLRKGAYAEPTLKAIHKKVEELNDHILPPGVKLVPFLDRSDLIRFTTHTVLGNLTHGFLLVAIVLLLFLGSARSALIVALTIPFSLLFASICLDLRKIPANLLSLGALDFGMVVDGAVVMVENIVRHLGRPEEAALSVGQRIRIAAHEVQRPVFYTILIIITAYVPIFTLEKVEGRIFRPMAWTVMFALLGALTFSILVAPVLASVLFRRPIRDWENPLLRLVTRNYRRALTWTVHHRWVMVGIAAAAFSGSLYLLTSGVIGSEFLPHLNEGSIWVRGTAPPSTGPAEGAVLMNRARIVFASFPEVTQVVSQIGRPDDGMDPVDFCNSEFFVDLKPKEQWRPQFHQNKEELVAAMDREVRKIPGVIWGFTQPIADDMEEAVSGVKGQLAIKIYGDDLSVLEQKGADVVRAMQPVRGVEDVGMFRVIGQPNLNFVVDRDAAARYQINVDDIQDAIQTAVGGNTIGEILQGEQRYDLVARYLPPYRDRREAIESIRLLSPSGERVSLSQLCKVRMADGASTLYREANSRYIGIKYSVRGRDLGSTVEEVIRKVNDQVKLPPRYSFEWAGEYQSQKRSEARLVIIVPLTVFLIFLIIFSAFGSAKWACLHLVNVAVARIGGLLALFITGTNFSVSSGVGFLALFGASVQTGVIMVDYINQLRARGFSVEEAAIEGAVRRLRPIMMTMLVATVGLLPAAYSHAIGSDSQRPFAIVIVGGLIVDLIMSTFLLPTFYVWWARPTDPLPAPVE
ncbi:MAG TPA: CusA/CzcA family heavy metal efflux RND transporter [Bryobacteraceae bacterium]|nr:CusA/CzcA family heavy metal efflux RND transporter [Bryobacteraceae bacterium]